MGEGLYCEDGGGTYELWSGDLSCPPRGELDFASVGKRIDPNGDTVGSCTFNQDPNFGALGGLEGFHATDVDLRLL
jgi:hypothetical protein